LVSLATASAFSQGSLAIEVPFADVSGAGKAVVLVGGMGGGTGGGMGGGMGGMTGGGMGGMTGGGMGGMIGGMGGMSGGMSGFGATPGNSFGSTYGGADPSSGGADPSSGGADPIGGGAQTSQYYLCVTPYDRCSFASSPGSRRSGSSCTCATGHRGTVK
jgi:hypothetical protein